MPTKENDRKKRSRSGRRRQAEDGSWIDTDRVVNKAQNIVSSAVNVLEEEIAAGILAAKKIEKKLIDVDELRSDPDDLMNRIRRDSHEALDLFIDVFASITGQLNSVVEALKKDTEEKTAASKKTAAKAKGEVMVLEADQPLRPGESVTLTLSLYDDGTSKSSTINLRKSDLIGQKNQRINLRAITIKPKTLSLKPKQEKDITITVKLPKNSQPGLYNALLTDELNPLIRILLSIEVIK